MGNGFGSRYSGTFPYTANLSQHVSSLLPVVSDHLQHENGHCAWECQVHDAHNFSAST